MHVWAIYAGRHLSRNLTIHICVPNVETNFGLLGERCTPYHIAITDGLYRREIQKVAGTRSAFSSASDSRARSLTPEPDAQVRYPIRPHTFVFLSATSRQVAVSYW